MRRISFPPRSLLGQIALLVAIALFVAQAINFALLYRERRELRFTQTIVPTVTRIIDAAERVQAGKLAPFERQRSRVRLRDRNPVPPGLRRADEIEFGIRQGLHESNIPYRIIVSGIRNVTADDPRLAGMRADRARRLASMGAEVIVAVQMGDGRWLVLNGPWPRTERALVGQLAAQTLILYIVVLLPVLWIGRRLTRPLTELTARARAFAPGGEREPMAEHGPGDIRALIAAYNDLSMRVSAMLDEKDRMLGAIGHDLRTPLSALRVRIESVEDDTDRQRMADIIEEMHRTLEDILSLARLGRPSEPMTDTDLAALVDAVVEDFRDLGHDVAFDEAERIRMRLRPSLMRRAVRNLIENAIKYAGAAEVHIAPDADRIAIAVMDRGPGLPPDKLEMVFDPFVRLETSRNRDTGGIGLGLALARAIVREAGGRVSLTNRQGGGLVARIELPRE